jgi:hypothetical protein
MLCRFGEIRSFRSNLPKIQSKTDYQAHLFALIARMKEKEKSKDQERLVNKIPKQVSIVMFH